MLQYYPAGGWRDFSGEFDTEEEAEAHLNEQIGEDDTRSGQVVDIGERK